MIEFVCHKNYFKSPLISSQKTSLVVLLVGPLDPLPSPLDGHGRVPRVPLRRPPEEGGHGDRVGHEGALGLVHAQAHAAAPLPGGQVVARDDAVGADVVIG